MLCATVDSDQLVRKQPADATFTAGRSLLHRVRLAAAPADRHMLESEEALWPIHLPSICVPSVGWCVLAQAIGSIVLALAGLNLIAATILRPKTVRKTLTPFRNHIQPVTRP